MPLNSDRTPLADRRVYVDLQFSNWDFPFFFLPRASIQYDHHGFGDFAVRWGYTLFRVRSTRR